MNKQLVNKEFGQLLYLEYSKAEYGPCANLIIALAENDLLDVESLQKGFVTARFALEHERQRFIEDEKRNGKLHPTTRDWEMDCKEAFFIAIEDVNTIYGKNLIPE